MVKQIAIAVMVSIVILFAFTVYLAGNTNTGGSATQTPVSQVSSTDVKFPQTYVKSTQTEPDMQAGLLQVKTTAPIETLLPLVTQIPLYAPILTTEEITTGEEFWYELGFPPDADLNEQSRLWGLLPQVVEVHKVPTQKLIYTPNDPKWSLKWDHKQVSDIDIDMDDAWEYTRGNKDVIIGIADTSLFWHLEDIRDNVWRNLGEDVDGDGQVILPGPEVNVHYTFDRDGDGIAEIYDFNYIKYEWDPDDVNGVDDDNNGYIDDFIGWDFAGGDNDPYMTSGSLDTQRHGTSTNGVAIAVGDNNFGIAGVCPNCTTIATAGGVGNPLTIKYLVDNGADAISLSWLGSYDNALGESLDYAYDHGVPVSVGIGNAGVGYNTMCNNEKIICVSGFAQSGQPSTGIYASLYGPNADIAAPTGIFTVAVPENPNYPSVWETGTSLATPAIAGIIGLMKDLDPDISHYEIKSILQSTASPWDTPPNEYYGVGRVNAKSALEMTLSGVNLAPVPVALLHEDESFMTGDNYVVYGVINGSGPFTWELYGALGMYPSAWELITQGSNIVDGLITTWPLDSNILSDYTLKLVVTDSYSRSASDLLYFLDALNARSIENWPLPGDTGASVLLDDLNGDNIQEILVAFPTSIRIYSSDSQVLFQNDFTIEGSSLNLATGDITGDGEKEIIVINSHDIYVFDSSLQLLPGWPLSNDYFTQVSVEDIDVDGKDEIIAISLSSASGIFSTIHVLDENAGEQAGWPVLIPNDFLASGVSIGDLDANGFQEIVISGIMGSLYVYRFNGNPYTGWPQIRNVDTFNSPILADMDNDGDLDFVFLQGTSLYVTDSQGISLPGWPVTAYSDSKYSVGDMDNDGFMELVSVSTTGIQVLNHDGSVVTGWNYNPTIAPMYPPTIADITGDSQQDILLVSQNTVVAVTATGLLSDFPQSYQGSMWYAPFIADINDDGNTEVVYGANYINAINLPYPYSGLAEWPIYRFDAGKTNNYLSQTVCGNSVCELGEACTTCPQDCSCDGCFFLDSVACQLDSSCEWCSTCSNTKTSTFGMGACNDLGACTYSCLEGSCGAECSDNYNVVTDYCDPLRPNILLHVTETCSLDSCQMQETITETNCADTGQVCAADQCQDVVDCTTLPNNFINCAGFNPGQCDYCSTCETLSYGIYSNRTATIAEINTCQMIGDCAYACILGSCGAQCGEDTDCPSVSCSSQSACYGGTYREYLDGQSSCDLVSCACTPASCDSYTEIITDVDGDSFDTECDADCNDNTWFMDNQGYCPSQEYYEFLPTGYDTADFALLKDAQGYIHNYYIRYPQGTAWQTDTSNSRDFGHARSLDLQTWEELNPILDVSESGGWDNEHVWAPSIVEDLGVYYMFYTGVTNGFVDPSLHQERIGIATSSDLLTWTRHPLNTCTASGDGCLWECDTSWSAWGNGGAWQAQCRDPYVFRDGTSWYMVYTTVLPSGEGVIGIAKSNDLFTWTDVGMIESTIKTGTVESASVTQLDGVYYLIWTSNYNGVLSYSTSSDLENGPWSTAQEVPGSAQSKAVASELLDMGEYYLLAYVYDDAPRPIHFKTVGFPQGIPTLRSISDPSCSYIDVSQVYPGATELCNGVDDDCDGVVDEGCDCIDGETQVSTCGVGECSGNTGLVSCVGGVFDVSTDTCDPLFGADVEICDGIDSNCDGIIDLDIFEPSTCGVGECSGNTGTVQCLDGAFDMTTDTCNPTMGSIEEQCLNGRDDDCDGETDEDCPLLWSDLNEDNQINIRDIDQANLLYGGQVSVGDINNDGYFTVIDLMYFGRMFS